MAVLYPKTALLVRLRNRARRVGAFTWCVAAVLLAGALAALIFMRWPNLDTRIAAMFYVSPEGFVARGWTINHLRRIADWSPLIICIGMIAAWILKTWGVKTWGFARIPAPSGRGVAFLVITLILGPGLLVNVGLKDHAHRPRPAHLAEFGGTATFRPFYRFNGTCGTNCSFVSGEVSTAAWTLAPALLVPRGRAVAIGASLVFAAAVALLRIAAGGHFLSDVTFSIVLTALVVLSVYRLLYRRRKAAADMSADALHVGWPAL